MKAKANNFLIKIKRNFTKKNIVQGIKLFFLSIILAIFLEFLMVGFYLKKYQQEFERSTGTKISEIFQTIKQAKKKSLNLNNQVTFLILGLDSLENRGDAPALTDTIMLSSVNFDSGLINILSLPRDLYHQDLQTKINALYYYGQNKYANEPERYVQEILAEMLKIKIDHTIVINLDNLASLIDLLGGIDVNIESSFIDNQFPRTDVDIKTVTDPAMLYETIEFKKGQEHMDGKRALQYIRSRHSESITGTDLSRSSRQQEVIRALLGTLQKFQKIIANPQQLAKLFLFYQNNFQVYLSFEDLLAIVFRLLPNSIKMTKNQLSIYEKNMPNAALIHPNMSFFQGQWVYIINDRQIFEQEVQSKLYHVE